MTRAQKFGQSWFPVRIIYNLLELDFCRFSTEFHQRNTVFEQKLTNFQPLKLGKKQRAEN
jgi:hypothetical protein